MSIPSMARGTHRVPVPVQRLFRTMVEMRIFEEALGELWQRGLISGELHLGIGEEGAIAGVLDHLRPGDSMATDHRSTPPFVARGSDLEALLLEALGSPDGLCHGRGGHMHLFDPDRLSASSGIVGAAACTACGFALAHQLQHRGNVAVAFFGEGAANQGMVLEAFNLAAIWRLPVVFVCKDSHWAVTTRSNRMTSGNLKRRAEAFGLPTAKVDGARPWTVWRAAARAVRRARSGRGPSLLLVHVWRPRGHLEDDPLVRIAGDHGEQRRETRELLRQVIGRPSNSDAHHGERSWPRMLGAAEVTRTMLTMIYEQRTTKRDPLVATARRLAKEETVAIRSEAAERVDDAVAAALKRSGVG